VTALLTPVDKGNARQAGATLWRKQLLPIGQIDYKGRRIAFTREYLAGLVKAFSNRAYDQVPFQLADAQNTHTNDPERFRGEVKGLELTPDGLDIIIAATDDGAKVLQQNPALGVSARIVEDYSRADGKHFPAAIQHVLGTLDPRIPGMRPWTAVEAANGDDEEVWDCSALEYATPHEPKPDPEPAPAGPAPAPAGATDEKDDHMALTADQEARLAKLLDLPDEQFTALITPVAETEDETVTDGDELTDEQLEQLLAEIETENAAETADATADTEPEPVLAGASLSNEAQTAIEMANARADEAMAEARRTRTQLDRATYEKERDHYQRSFGVPARITDLARPLLEGSGRTVDLSNGASVDAGAIVRKLIGEFGRTMQSLGMNVELGNAEGADIEGDRAERENAERGEFVKAYRSQMGL
jgi:hypothetical protein